MSKWEKYRLAATQAQQQNQSQNQTPNRRQNYLFLFKKHLFCDHFMNLADPVEKELLYHQVLHGLRSERFPISEMEAVSRYYNYNDQYYYYIDYVFTSSKHALPFFRLC